MIWDGFPSEVLYNNFDFKNSYFKNFMNLSEFYEFDNLNMLGITHLPKKVTFQLNLDKPSIDEEI